MPRFQRIACISFLAFAMAAARDGLAQGGDMASFSLIASASLATLPDAPAPAFPQNGQSSSQPAQSSDEKGQRQKAEEQLREEEHQRVLGIVPAFGTSYRQDAAPLTGMQKIRLAFRSSVDPVTFGTAFLVGAYHDA